jgi:lysophospholipase L1-like esterase
MLPGTFRWSRAFVVLGAAAAMTSGCGLAPSAAHAGVRPGGATRTLVRAEPGRAVRAGRPPRVAPPGAPSYVAMGGSFAAGSGIGPDLSSGCLRSARDYPHLLAGRLRLDLVDVTCAGAVVANLLDARQHGRPPQIDAVNDHTRLVTITIGGNNLRYSATSARCLTAARQRRPCLDLPSAAEVTAAAAQLRAGLLRLLGAVHSLAPAASVYLLGYPRVFPDPPRGCADNPLTVTDTATLARMGEVLDATLRSAAADARVSFLDVYSASGGRDVCANGTTRWVDGSETHGLPYHPNARGAAAVAGLLATALTHRGAGTVVATARRPSAAQSEDPRDTA